MKPTYYTLYSNAASYVTTTIIIQGWLNWKTRKEHPHKVFHFLHISSFCCFSKKKYCSSCYIVWLVIWFLCLSLSCLVIRHSVENCKMGLYKFFTQFALNQTSKRRNSHRKKGRWQPRTIKQAIMIEFSAVVILFLIKIIV